jgi:hypothetical protein
MCAFHSLETLDVEITKIVKIKQRALLIYLGGDLLFKLIFHEVIPSQQIKNV